eukprot:CCRYP_007229-RA/>CCRYP_007229-RA protein AED:0.39 eAED:0.39 QI:430/1/1/1/1/1/2/42/458
MYKDIRRFVSILASIVSPSITAAHRQHHTLPLVDFQRLLRTDLDNELAKILHDAPTRKETHLPDNVSIHSKQHSNIRKRSIHWNENIKNSFTSSSYSNNVSGSSSYAIDRVWSNLVKHAWHTAETVHRSALGSFTKTSNSEEDTIPCPFLVCTMEIPGHDRHTTSTTSNDYQKIIASFNKGYEESLLVKSAHNETCAILTLTAVDARHSVESYKGDHNIVLIPLVDVMKIHSGTIDEVSSLGWSVPYVNNSMKELSNTRGRSMNATEMLHQWERLIIVDFVPGLGGMREEAELLKVVNTMMGDIQDMGEVGWLGRLDDAERRAYQIDESLTLVPALSEMFSLTASLGGDDDSDGNDPNSRIMFWKEALQNGIESEHSCSEMFSTLFVKPRAGYYSFDVILNPADGPPPNDYESSASNPACVTSLIAGLSLHPYVLSVKSNFPIYHGYYIAQKIDSYKL